MKRRLPKGLLLLFALAFQPGLAQEESGQEEGGQDSSADNEEQPAEQQQPETEGNEQAGDASPESPGDISRAFEDFVPSTQVSEDLSVAFPVDI